MVTAAEFVLIAVAVIVAAVYLARNMYRTFAGKASGCHCPSEKNCASSSDAHTQNP